MVTAAVSGSRKNDILGTLVGDKGSQIILLAKEPETCNEQAVLFRKSEFFQNLTTDSVSDWRAG